MDKIQKIKKSIEPIISLTEDELSTFCSAFEYKSLRKNEFFLKEGQGCNFIGLFTSGVVIFTKTLEKGCSLLNKQTSLIYTFSNSKN